MAKYKSNPKIIEAFQWTGKNADEISKFTDGGFNYGSDDLRAGWPEETVDTITWAEVYNESQLSFNSVNIGDYIIKGTQNEFYPCEENIFKESYSLVEDENANELGLYQGELKK